MHKATGPAALRPCQVGKSAAAAAALVGDGDRPLHPQSSSCAAAVPAVVMTLPLSPAMRLGQEGGTSLVPVVAPLARAPPGAVATAAALALGQQPPLGCIVLGAGTASAEAVLAACTVATAQPPLRVAPGLPPAGSSRHAILRRAQGGRRGSSQPPPQRQRSQPQRSAEFDWSASDDKQETGSSSHEDGDWEQDEELSELILLADSAVAWRTPPR